MNRDKILHILRNPYGHTEDEIRQARLAAADLIEYHVRMVYCANCGEDRTLKGSAFCGDLVFCDEACLMNYQQ